MGEIKKLKKPTLVKTMAVCLTLEDKARIERLKDVHQVNVAEELREAILRRISEIEQELAG